MTIQVAGNANSGVVEVEANTLATRCAFFPINFNGLAGGIYKITAVCAPVVGNLVSISQGPIFALQWVSRSTIGRVKRVILSTSLDNTTVVENYNIRLFKASIDEQYDANNAFIIAPDSRLRATMSRMGSLEYADFNVAAAATGAVAPVAIAAPGVTNMTGGTLTLESQPLAAQSTSKLAAAFSTGNVYARNEPMSLIDTQAGDCPLDLTFKTGFVLTYDFPNTTGGASINFSIDATIEELPPDFA